VPYSEYYMEDTSQQVNTDIAFWMNCLTVNIIWMILKSRWTLILHFEWIYLQWILYGRYLKAGEQWYWSLNEMPYSECYMEDTSQQENTDIAVWMKCLKVNIIGKILHSKWTLILQFRMKYLTVSIIWKILQCSWTLNDVVYSEYYMEVTSQQVNTVLQFELSAFHWIIYGKYFRACELW
jgi:hypothetical protein